MAAYQHVVVVMSIILGMAVTQLLKGAAQLYRTRARLRTYWLHWAWVTLLVLFSFLLWWTFWNYRDISEWDFVRFVIYLCPTIVFYLVTALAFPDPSDSVANMTEYYYTNRGGFFGALALHGALTGVTAVVVRGLSILDLSNLFRAVMIILLLIAAKSANARVHAAVWTLCTVLMVAFVIMFQFRLA